MSQTEMLLGQVREGNSQAFETIFHAYYGRVHRVAYRLLGSGLEADDVAQETFLQLYRRPLPPGRAHNLEGWLLRVATNLAYNVIRGRARRQAREIRAAGEGAGQGAGQGSEPDSGSPAGAYGGEIPDNPDAGLLHADLAGRVRDALARLNERQVQLLLLRQAGLTYAEIAAALGIAPGSVGTLLARAEQAFRNVYEGPDTE